MSESRSTPAYPSIVGTETEFGIIIRGVEDMDYASYCLLLVNSFPERLDGERIWDYDLETPMVDARGFKAKGFISVPSKKDNMAINNILSNGARYYVDHAHPEYSTPECGNVREALCYEKAGERIVELSRRMAGAALPAGREIIIYKNNSDQKGNSYGYHENYLMTRRVPFSILADKLIPFLVTRQIFCGAGKVGSENGRDEVPYQVSQRADFFETEVGLETMAKRPIVNTRDEPHADNTKYRRLHVITGDANMSEYTTYLKVGTLSIVAEMIDEGFLETPCVLRASVDAMTRVSHDPDLRGVIELDDGKKVRAVDVQRMYLEAAHRYYADREMSPIAKDVLAKWEFVLDALETDFWKLERYVDWVAKRRILREYAERKGLKWHDPKIRMMDLQYHDSRPERSLYALLERQGRMERILTDGEIEQAMREPPPSTRAYFRGACLRKFPENVAGVNWDSISFRVGEGPIKRVMMKEPGRGTRHHVQALLDSVETVEELIEKLSSL